MKINALSLPAMLAADIESDWQELGQQEMSRLKTMLRQIGSPAPRLYDQETVVSENLLWESEAALDYQGTSDVPVTPGDIDPKLTLIFGEAEPDSPIALDYRTARPRVIYFGDVDYKCCWIELSPSYEGFKKILQG